MSNYPSDWRVERLGNLFPKIVVGYVGNVNDYYCAPDEGVSFYRTLNIRDGEFRHIDLRYVTHEFHRKNKKSRISNGDILIARVGANLGMVCNVKGIQGEANIANAIIIKTAEVEIAHSDFYTYFLLSPMGKSQIFAGAAGGAQGVFNTKLTQEIKAPIPPLPEQRKIADILSTWDAAIEKTVALLATAKAQKRALMQSLLTGKRRFPEFEGQPWKEVRLGELGSFKKGKGLPKTEVGSVGQFPCVLYGQLYTTYGEVINQTKSRTNLNDGIISVAGDVLIPASTTTTGIDLAIASCVTIGGVRLGGDINVFRRDTDDINGTFLAYFLSHARRHEMARYAQGVTIIHLKGSDLLDIPISVPSIAEQDAIIDVVKDVEKQVSDHQTDLTKLRTEKKALMQQLLTGKRRVTL